MNLYFICLLVLIELQKVVILLVVEVCMEGFIGRRVEALQHDLSAV